MKNKKHLTREQRYQIEALLKAGKSQKEIGIIIDKDKSVISREIKRNSNKHGRYIASQAQELCEIRKERFCYARKFTSSIEKYIREHLITEQWSPEQIAGKARKDGVAMVSVERIYQFIREDKAKGGSLYRCLRHRLKHRKRPVGENKEIIKNKTSIEKRPDVINNKERFGDWEIDLIVGENNKGAILTAVERTTGFLLMKKLSRGKNAQGLKKEVIRMFLPYKQKVFSITSDNGTEFAEHHAIAKALDLQYFFAHPYSSWERGLNEYTNKLIRQYIPKKQTFANYTDKDIMEIQYKINRRPRKNLNFECPKNEFYKQLNQKVAFTS